MVLYWACHRKIFKVQIVFVVAVLGLPTEKISKVQIVQFVVPVLGLSPKKFFNVQIVQLVVLYWACHRKIFKVQIVQFVVPALGLVSNLGFTTGLMRTAEGRCIMQCRKLFSLIHLQGTAYFMLTWVVVSNILLSVLFVEMIQDGLKSPSN